MRIHRIVVGLLVVGSVVGVAGQRPGVSPSALLDDVRAGDVSAVTTRLETGADPDTRDATGSTALMYAAAFASGDMVRTLLDAGASVNAANAAGATALMWATHDAAKVDLLIERGAHVNASRADGATALISAALRGRTDVMQRLLAAGADRLVGRVNAPWPMNLSQIAATTNDPAMRAFIDPAQPPPAGRGAPPPLTQLMLTHTFSWRPQPAGTNAEAVAALLDAGADANETVGQLELPLPAVARAAMGIGDAATMRVLLDRGADPNRAGVHGLTPLMVAALNPEAATAQLLLDRGADPAAVDARGHSALDWALRLGETTTSAALRRAGATERAQPAAVPPVVSRPRTGRDAIEIALSRLQPAGPAFYDKTRCISCHNQSLPAVAVKLADGKGVKLDRELAAHPTRATMTSLNASRENMMIGNCSVFGFIGNITYGLFGLAEEGVAPNATTDAAVSCLTGLQRVDGSWDGADPRPPLAGGDAITYTALAARGLAVYTPPGRRADATARVTRALTWLRTATPRDTQQDAFKLLGLVWLDAGTRDIAAQASRVSALQRADGGWGQMPTMPSDPYATGQALYALYAAGLDTSSETYRRGVAYLLQTQREDGTWHVRSRVHGFQPYVEAGFPGGPDQFISAAATAWAVMGVAPSLPEP